MAINNAYPVQLADPTTFNAAAPRVLNGKFVELRQIYGSKVTTLEGKHALRGQILPLLESGEALLLASPCSKVAIVFYTRPALRLS